MDNSKFSVFSTTYIDKTKENNLYIKKSTNLYVHWDLLLSDMLNFTSQTLITKIQISGIKLNYDNSTNTFETL